MKWGHAEAIVTQLTGKLVPLTFQIFSLSLQSLFFYYTLFFVSFLSKRSSAFKFSTTVEIVYTYRLLSLPPFVTSHAPCVSLLPWERRLARQRSNVRKEFHLNLNVLLRVTAMGDDKSSLNVGDESRRPD